MEDSKLEERQELGLGPGLGLDHGGQGLGPGQMPRQMQEVGVEQEDKRMTADAGKSDPSEKQKRLHCFNVGSQHISSLSSPLACL